MTQPGGIYYLILYALIIILQFYKTYPLIKDDPAHYNWRDYFYVSLQVVYSAAGVVILLLAQLKEWIGVIMLGYAALIVFTSYLDPVGARFKQNTRFALHIVIIVIIVATTVYSYERVLPKSISAKTQQNHHYKVVLPYRDHTLESWFGPGRVRDVVLYFSATVEGASRGDAVVKALNVALAGQHGSIMPFRPSGKGKRSDVEPLTEEATVEEVFYKQIKNEAANSNRSGDRVSFVALSQ